MILCRTLYSIFSLSLIITSVADAQPKYAGVLGNLVVVEKESAEAKRVRLEWITTERNRIREELKGFEKELAQLQESVPDPIRQRVVPPAIARERAREEVSFNNWAQNNNPAMRFAVIRGEALNALLRVLGPIAHYRKMRTGNSDSAAILKSLEPGYRLQESDVNHFRLNPATSTGSRTAIRLNQLPLDIEWPTAVRQFWEEDRVRIEKARNVYVERLISADGVSHLDQADLLDTSLKLLQAKIQQKIGKIFSDPSVDALKRLETQQDLKFAIREIEKVRANIGRLKKVPGDYKVHRFPGGSIEDFLDYCFMKGLIFQEAQPADEESYRTVYHRMQDYAHDVQYVEDWKSDIQNRIKDLDEQDKKLVWAAAEQ